MVAIDMPPDWAPAAASTVVGRCERVLGPGQCVAARQRGSAEYFAVIRPDDADPATRLQIEFGRADAPGVVLAHRALLFAEHDPTESRWASLGLIVAGLVAAAEASEPAVVAPAGTPAAAAPAAPAKAAPRRWGLDAGALTGSGFERAWYRTGGFARAWLTLPSAPHVVAVLGARYAAHGGEPFFQWAGGSLGAGARLGAAHATWDAELLGELVVERLSARASHPTQGSESGSQMRFGGRLGLNTSLRLVEALRLVAGAEAETMSPPLRLEIRSAPAGREPAARFTLTLGLRFPL